MVSRRDNIGPAIVFLLLMCGGGVASWFLAAPALSEMARPNYDVTRMVFTYSTLPRLATALIAGAALALSGALLQQVLRNPLADPTTLGVSAGANLALVVTSLFLPDLLGAGRDLVALIGSATAAAIVVSLGARRGFSPYSLVLSGLVLSLWCGGLAAILTYLNQRYLSSLFIWGAGSLAQQSWVIPLSLLWKLAVIAIGCAFVMRPLSLLDLGESSSTALGVRLVRLRFVVVALAVALAAFVTSAVGVIGFIGLVAPTIARLSGARRPAQLILWSPLIGAGLLFFADSILQLVAGGLGDFLPTGAVTAIFGSPLLLALLPRLKIRHRLQSPAFRRPRRWDGTAPVIIAAAGLFVLLMVSAFLGRDVNGDWAFTSGEFSVDVLAIRIPKILAALTSGAMLAVAGSILQRLTGNEMASPEVLGISAGATFGVAIALFAVAPGFSGQFAFAVAGAISVLFVIFVSSRRSAFAPERVLLAGIALSAMVDAVVGVLSSTGDPRAVLLMRWMSGSTYLIEGSTAAMEVALGAVLIAVSLATRRWLDILPLGPSPSAAVGIPLAKSRFALFGLAGLLTAAATLTVGPLSFIGLMGPHLAREAGLARALPQMVGAALIGGGLMVAADFVGRTIVSPYQIPAGLVSALIGAPFLMLMMRKRSAS
ncbi:Fe(3+)-hydroxamate ABC transporter permease FhuB [Rhizobium leguminosarum]|uniref:Fe(3+)-hydroxamate ABC transporter permease FhuB n=1 Tax=Rhizobium leguminosarum TaxID=384 RepID=A0A4Q8XRU1_RHILE|nr:Fe(3+)-hydroxamate ABC transporter permease FhuB [Rhizobium leguminosarum]TAU79772.1 Fe(3+)-hydroxamate ABC transporter permease FhuB [Rhizobium leguminosarum]TAV43596.1 Fe(3+)-hydroxamate ABC transporter permease FhuB [Rhizobium leguminosarum]TAV82704.1 Fe(3+)-hydroxamate ABC transporter permease FhuB [Rhizobium leguminosarum]TAV83480.1 Fe(3+)-hydroxamate ABC transporter permease FhuB [Rhizobium leguminosarum]TAW14040.1 Fe(3+)-hydroxamate ABC transporter permease FhuB [Rhizobium leguminosa